MNDAVPMSEAEIETWARNAASTRVFEAYAHGVMTSEDAVTILMLKQRIHLPRWVRKALEWVESL